MTLEIEQKFRVADPGPLRQRLGAESAVFAPAVEHADHYFAHPARDFAQTDEALRIRSVGAANVITYKGPKQRHAVKTRREVELPLASGAEAARQFAELLELLGFRSVAIVRKRREQGALVWKGREINVALDDAGPLGQFCEIELCVEESETAIAQQLVTALASNLGLADVERRSYLALQLAAEGRHTESVEAD
jgi:adenylate cyclase class 2